MASVTRGRELWHDAERVLATEGNAGLIAWDDQRSLEDRLDMDAAWREFVDGMRAMAEVMQVAGLQMKAAAERWKETQHAARG